MPSSIARYSATLLVASPIVSLRSASTSPSGSRGDGGDRRRAGVSPRPAVDVDDDLQALTSASDFASAITFWARCEGTSSWWANSIV